MIYYLIKHTKSRFYKMHFYECCIINVKVLIHLLLHTHNISRSASTRSLKPSLLDHNSLS